MRKRKAHSPGSEFYIIWADTFEYVEGDLINGVTPRTKAQEDLSFFGRKKQISPSDLQNPPWGPTSDAGLMSFWADGEAQRLGVTVDEVLAAWQKHGASRMFEDIPEDGNGVSHPPLAL